ncbi:MAG: signal peptidase I [Lachnospiraceae bacterium]|nr:signal peptidase I [Lachnospiraceae bacterium]
MYENNGEKTETTGERPSFVKELISWTIIFAIALTLSLFLHRCVIINAKIPSGSMETTIMTGDRMIGNRLAYINSEPKRGDVIIFKYPDDESQNFIKRVIGLPGEKVTITDSHIYIDEKEIPLEESYLPEEWINGNDGLEYIVPEDSYFVLGDNRNISKDARFWENTYVKRDKIIAKAGLVYWPLSDVGFVDSAEYSIDK